MQFLVDFGLSGFTHHYIIFKFNLLLIEVAREAIPFVYTFCALQKL